MNNSQLIPFQGSFKRTISANKRIIIHVMLHIENNHNDSRYSHHLYKVSNLGHKDLYRSGRWASVHRGYEWVTREALGFNASET